MIKKKPLLICAALVVVALQVYAADSLVKPNSTRAAALSEIGLVDLDNTLGPLYQLARQNKQFELLEQLHTVADDNSRSLAARESILYQFAAGLGDLPPWQGGFEVLEFLGSYQPRILVPHDDHSAFGIPLFNIRSAAAGSTARWHRFLAGSRAARQLAQGADSWKSAFTAATPAQRRGYIDALERASHPQLQDISGWALANIQDDPTLTLVAARSSMLLSDSGLFSQALTKGSGPEIAAALRQIPTWFDEIQAETILRQALANAPPVNASLAMSLLAPGLIQYPDVAELIFQTLDHPGLGSTAALVLSGSRDPAIRQRLLTLSHSDDSLAGKRASLALEAEFAAGGSAEK